MNGTAIKNRSTMQPTIALSSGEAELTAFVKGSLACDMGLELTLVVVVDSSAAVEMVNRSGVGRVRHLDVKDLWVQERVKRGFFTIVRVPGDSNPADVATQPLAVAELQDKISLVNAHIVARKPRWADMSE